MENTGKHTQSFTIPKSEERYDLSLLEEMDDNEYVPDVLNILLWETPRDLKEMKEALRTGNADIVFQKAHKLKSSAGIKQAVKLNGLLANIETIGKKGSNDNELRSLVENAAHQYSSIEKALEIHVEESQ